MNLSTTQQRAEEVIEKARAAMKANGGAGTDAELVGYLAAWVTQLQDRSKSCQDV